MQYYATIDETGMATGFYNDHDHPVIPSAAVPITQAVWQEYLDHQGHRSLTPEGQILDRAPLPTLERLQAEQAGRLWEIRRRMDLAEDFGQDTTALVAYRQAVARLLVDVTDPLSVVWPPKPWEQGA